MTLKQKREIFGTIMIILAIFMIITIARGRHVHFPKFYLDFSKGNIEQLIIANLNWPFKFICHGLYTLFGWTALFAPFFLFFLGTTYFVQRETQKVKRKRIILLWGFGELAFLIYYINYLSFVIVSKKLRAGKLAKLFADYLHEVGGGAFISIFFIWSLLSYIIYIRKSSWKESYEESKKFMANLMLSISNVVAKIIHKTSSTANTQSISQKKKIENESHIEKDEDVGEISEDNIQNDDEKRNDNVTSTGKANIDAEDNTKQDEISNDSKVQDNYFSKESNQKKLSIKIFDSTSIKKSFNFDVLYENETHEYNKEKLEELRDQVEENFSAIGINLNRTGVTIGPRLFRLEYELPKNIQLKDIEKFQEELTVRMGGIPIDIELPIQGTNTFGIYLERDHPDTLAMGSYLEKIKTQKEKLPLFTGVAQDGSSLWTDAAEFPHLLIAGTTGSGKSVFLNSMIINMLAASEFIPTNIILIDPKHIEFSPYSKLPQLSCPIITEVDDARKILMDAEELMEQRYQLITTSSVRNISEYNERDENNTSKIPYLLIIIDEFSDLVMQDSSGAIKKSIIRLAQKSRAVGIHLVLATQRPSSDIIDGLIKANFPSRIAFKTSSKVDSRIIIDENGAEVLLGKGDMIVKTIAKEKTRLQGIYVSIEEIKNIVESYI